MAKPTATKLNKRRVKEDFYRNPEFNRADEWKFDTPVDDIRPLVKRFFGLLLLLIFVGYAGYTTVFNDMVAGRSKRESIQEEYLKTQETVVTTPVDGHAEIVNTYYHDKFAFTQGLAFYKGELYESTGLNGRSSIRKVDLESGKVLQQLDIADTLFGEGITIVNDLIYFLTWKSKRAFVYTLDFELVEEFSIPSQGWGITWDTSTNELLYSDGTAMLRWINPNGFEVTRFGSVTYLNDKTGMWEPLEKINELEMIDQELYANVWYEDRIAVIDTITYKVTRWIDCADIAKDHPRRGGAVLNGIAYNDMNKQVYITGKLWSRLYQVKW